MYSENPQPAPAFWLGGLEPWWAWEGLAAARLILSARRIQRRESGARGKLRRADVPLFIDSGAFSEVSQRGGWDWSPQDYAAFIARISSALGTVEHVGIQDWMCEPQIIAKTGLTLEEHQRRTVKSFVDLKKIAPAIPFVPTLQGITAADYLRCAEMYNDAGVRLEDESLVGIGSVCRRSGSTEIEAVLREVKAGLPSRARLHGFGVKSEGALLACWDLASVDSMAWSRRARGLEVDLRRSLGLPSDAPSVDVLRVPASKTDAIDLDLADFLDWKRERCPKTAAVSQEFAEDWRLRQCQALAARVVDTMERPVKRRAAQRKLGCCSTPISGRTGERELEVSEALQVLGAELPVTRDVTVSVGDVGPSIHGFAEEYDDGEMFIRLAPRRWRRGLLDSLAHEWAHLRVWSQDIHEADHGPRWRSELEHARQVLGVG